MKVLVVGHGAREHAIAKKLTQEDLEIISFMSRVNPGIKRLSVETRIFDILDPSKYKKLEGIDLAFIGPDPALAAGISDRIIQEGIPVVGPEKKLAKLEWSKSYAREIMDENDIEGNPDFKICRTLSDVKEFYGKHPEMAVKPDVLTGGKGVKITGEHLNSKQEVLDYAVERIEADGLVVLEEKLVGREFTLQAFTDGHHLEIMPLVRDYKRAYDGDQGPNTGSMGSFSCADHMMPDLPHDLVRKGTEIMKKTIQVTMEQVGEYKGILYGGFMHTAKGVYLIEYNARFGDPEAMNVLSLLDTPLTEIGFSIDENRLAKPIFQPKATVCVYIVPEGYPTNPLRDQEITIGPIRNSETYYASVYEENGKVKTTTSRAIALLGKGDTVNEARERVYSDVNNVTGRLFHRTDIGKGI
jgi:phosphoribosylamine--glycine ligase